MLRMMRRLSGGKPSNSHAVPATESPLCRADCPLQLDGPFLDLHVRRVDIDAVAGPDTLVHHPDADIHAPLQDIVSPRERPAAAVPALLIIWSIFLTCASATAPVSSFMRKLNPMMLRSPTCTPVRFGVCPWSCSAKARQYSSSSSVTTNPPSPAVIVFRGAVDAKIPRYRSGSLVNPPCHLVIRWIAGGLARILLPAMRPCFLAIAAIATRDLAGLPSIVYWHECAFTCGC